MRTKFLLCMAFIATICFNVVAQALLVDEEISSDEWQAELLRLNPGQDDGGMLINPNATNPLPYAVPVVPDNQNFETYGNLNKVDFYFGRYRLEGEIESTPRYQDKEPMLITCPEGVDHTHSSNGAPLAFRFTNPGGKFEIEELPSVGTVTMHVLNGNPTEDCNLVLEKYNTQMEMWEHLHTFLLRGRYAVRADNVLDDILSFDVNSSTPLKIRLHNYKINDDIPARFINLYHISVTSYGESAVARTELSNIKQMGRNIILPEPMSISVYNATGSLILQENAAEQIEIPNLFGKGVFILKTEKGNRKILL